MKRYLFFILLGAFSNLFGTHAIPYSGKIAIEDVNYEGMANFSFSLVDANGTVAWRNSSDLNQTIPVLVTNGRYSVLLGGQGMNPLSPELFLKNKELKLRVFFGNNDGTGLRHLLPDQVINPTPRSLVAEWAKMAQMAQSVPAASITQSMLSPELLADLNRTITRSMLSPELLADLNRTITRSMLPVDLLTDLNRSITREMLPKSILADLNRTITRSMLSPELLADLNRTITRSMLPARTRKRTG
jgi:hypothetical protein